MMFGQKAMRFEIVTQAWRNDKQRGKGTNRSNSKSNDLSEPFVSMGHW